MHLTHLFKIVCYRTADIFACSRLRLGPSLLWEVCTQYAKIDYFPLTLRPQKGKCPYHTHTPHDHLASRYQSHKKPYIIIRAVQNPNIVKLVAIHCSILIIATTHPLLREDRDIWLNAALILFLVIVLALQLAHTHTGREDDYGIRFFFTRGELINGRVRKPGSKEEQDQLLLSRRRLD